MLGEREIFNNKNHRAAEMMGFKPSIHQVIYDPIFVPCWTSRPLLNSIPKPIHLSSKLEGNVQNRPIIQINQFYEKSHFANIDICMIYHNSARKTILFHSPQPTKFSLDN